MSGLLTSCAVCGRAVVASTHKCPVKPSGRPVLVADPPMPMLVTKPAETANDAPKQPHSKGRPVHLSPACAAIMGAARSLPSPFTREDLAVQCWRMYPERFALSGHAEHVNVTAVWCRVNGQGGLIYRGLLSQCRDDLRVTVAGMRLADAKQLAAKMRGAK